jgi:hypothetical protein
MLKTYIMRKQNNQIGYHAGFDIKCLFQENEYSNKLLSFEIDKLSSEWKEACIHGINLFYTAFREKLNGELKISIKAIHWFPVDTKEIIVTYTIVRTLCHWFQLDFLPILKQAKFESLFFLNELDFRTDDETSFYI